MSFSDPCIITNSISGVVANREQCPAIPYTPEEYGEEARRVVEEGASMIHIHARKPDGSPSFEIEDFRNITEAILGAVDDVIDPRETRPTVIRAFEMAATKRVERPWKKHGVMPV